MDLLTYEDNCFGVLQVIHWDKPFLFALFSKNREKERESTHKTPEDSYHRRTPGIQRVMVKTLLWPELRLEPELPSVFNQSKSSRYQDP